MIIDTVHYFWNLFSIATTILLGPQKSEYPLIHYILKIGVRGWNAVRKTCRSESPEDRLALEEREFQTHVSGRQHTDFSRRRQVNTARTLLCVRWSQKRSPCLALFGLLPHSPRSRLFPLRVRWTRSVPGRERLRYTTQAERRRRRVRWDTDTETTWSQWLSRASQTTWQLSRLRNSLVLVWS